VGRLRYSSLSRAALSGVDGDDGVVMVGAGPGAGSTKLMQPEVLKERGIHEFDAWASSFVDTRTELKVQPPSVSKATPIISTSGGQGKPVSTRPTSDECKPLQIAAVFPLIALSCMKPGAEGGQS